jgi:NTP pyrophosphatase (non-canonical NTP hydrolase)
MTRMSKWIPTTNLMELRRLGKLGEELGELSNVASRCIIQGLDETDPGSGKVNRQRLQDELADVQAQIGCTVLAFGLDQDYMARRTAEKMRQMAEWEAMFATDGVIPSAQPSTYWMVERGPNQGEQYIYWWDSSAPRGGNWTRSPHLGTRFATKEEADIVARSLRNCEATEHPDLLARALRIERAASVSAKAKVGLGGRFSWDDVIRADEEQLKLLPDVTNDIPCGCFDGGENA